MKNKNRNKFILCFVIVIVILLISLVVIFNNSVKLDDNINNEGNGEIVDNNDDDIVVNNVVDATNKINLGSDLTAQVIDGVVKIGDKILEIKDKDVEVVTGYYYQPGAIYCLFAKTTDKNIYVLNFNKGDEIDIKNFKNSGVTDIDKLSLYDVTVNDDLVGQVDERNRVYAINEDKKIQLDTYCFTYDELD